MSEDLSKFNANPGAIWGTHDPAPWGAKLQYTTNHPPEALERDNYFLPVRSAFRRHTHKPGANPYQPGDKIEATCFRDDGSWTQAMFEVYYVDDFCVRVERLTDWRQSRQANPGMDNLQAEHKGFGRWTVSYANGKPYRQNVTKEEAERLVGHALGAAAKDTDAA